MVTLKRVLIKYKDESHSFFITNGSQVLSLKDGNKLSVYVDDLEENEIAEILNTYREQLKEK